MQLGAEPLQGHYRYTKLKDLNKGTYGFVQLALDQLTGDQVAIKFIPRGEKITKYVEREIVNHSHLLHPHIIKFEEVFLTANHLAIVMEFAPGGDMYQHVKLKKRLQEFEARWFFQQLIIGLDYCHKKGVVSRDIKLENTLLDGSRRPLLKICDFGYSKHAQDSLPKSKVGTPGYTAPEIISNQRHYDGKMVDVWSAGVMLYVMLFCRYPFERPEDQYDSRRFQKVLQRILRVEYEFPSNVQISRECSDLLQRIFVADPSQRITIAGIQNHPWYLKDLPPGLNEFNMTCLANQKAQADVLPDVDQIKAIVREAKHLAGQPQAASLARADTNVSDDNSYIDDVMDQEQSA